MEHTFLFTEGEWRADGSYFTGGGETLAARGRTTVSHGPEVWINDGILVVGEEGGDRFRSTYRIRPFGPDDRTTSWTAENPALGTLRGHFAVADDTILSVYRSDGGDVSGSESLRRISPRVYESRGTVRLGQDEISAWALRLVRTEGEGTSR